MNNIHIHIYNLPVEQESGDDKEVEYYPALTHEQRRSMFALFRDAFGGTDREARHRFTAMSLGRDYDLSWSGDLTRQEATKIMDDLTTILTIQEMV